MPVCLVSLKRHFLQSRPLIPWLSLPTHNCGAMGLGRAPQSKNKLGVNFSQQLCTSPFLLREGYWSYVEDNGGIEIRQVGKPVPMATAFRAAHAR
ncbi:hypothetical protein TNCV_1110631 [Trichonephila clavipes]|nr:hypothetical protein TNCV_1110631 [Trichonephila clavipes]